MQKRKWMYIWLGVIIVLLVLVSWWSSNNQSKALLERKQLTELLRARDKQLNFYFNKVNELLAEKQDSAWQNELVTDKLDSEEYKAILAEYREHYGVIDESHIPKTETLGGLKYKVEDSIKEGYDLLPNYYGWTHVLMWTSTKEFEQLDSLVKEAFGTNIPTEQIGGTMEELIEIVIRSIEENKNLLPSYYKY